MYDKVAHIAVSFTLVTILNTILPISLAVGLVIVIGILKELYDNKFDWKDMVANLVGISTAILISII